MARRGPLISLDRLVAELKDLETRRAEIVQTLKSQLSAWSSERQFPWRRRPGRPAASVPGSAGGPAKRHGRRRMSAAARAKLRASAKARWAAAKKAGKTR